MKQTFLMLLSMLATVNMSAQDVTPDSSLLRGEPEVGLSIDAAMDACIAMRDAVASNDTAAIRQSASDLREAGTVAFSSLRCKDDSIASLRGHLVFDEAFADSLANGNTSVYDLADDVNRTKAHRGQTADGSILTKTCFVKAGQSTRYSFASKGRQELAVVAEAGGLVTMKIHVTNSAGLDERHDDTKSVRQGLPQRKTSFNLPSDRRNTVELEIINCGDRDCTFVVISN